MNALSYWLNRVTSPEGCTAVDARKLREYNHNLAIENDALRERLEKYEGKGRALRFQKGKENERMG
jgi:regulator of replication initiation timing